MMKTDPHQPPRLLVVDDDRELRRLLDRYLTGHGFEVTTVADGEALEAMLAKGSFDLVILDLMLPGEDGLSLARRIRHRGELPIVMLSACGEDVDRIVGLEVGADDYLPKPFNPRELLARIRAVLRRSGNTATEAQAAVRFGPFLFDAEARRLTREGSEIALTTGEFTLLSLFTRHPNQVLSRDRLLQLLKGYEHQPFDRSVDVRVTRLRRKIEPDPASPTYIRTVWGEGYLFSPGGPSTE